MKCTLCKIISGLIPATTGSMQLSGNDFHPHNKQQAEAAGVEIVQQELNLIGTLSVAENLFLTRLPSLGNGTISVGFGIPSFIVTLGMLEIARGATKVVNPDSTTTAYR